MTKCYQDKVLQVINSLKIGGAEKLVVDFVITAKKKYNWDMEILILFGENLFQNELQKAQIKVMGPLLNHKFDFLHLYRLISKIARGGYSIINVHLFPASLYVALASFFLRKKTKLIFTEHSVWNRRRLFFGFKLLDRFIYSRFAKIVCVSEQVRRELVDWLPNLRKKTIVVPNAVAVPRSTTNVAKEFDLIFVGRLTKAKGVDILLKALAQLKDEGIFVVTAVVGDGPLMDCLKGMAKNMGIENLVHFLGTQKFIFDFYQRSKILVLPSRWEGLPLVILEAMGSGIPVIATSVGGIVDVIRNYREGILIPPENVAELKKAIIILLRDSKLAGKLALNAKRKFKAIYSMERYIDRISEIYKRNRN